MVVVTLTGSRCAAAVVVAVVLSGCSAAEGPTASSGPGSGPTTAPSSPRSASATASATASAPTPSGGPSPASGEATGEQPPRVSADDFDRTVAMAAVRRLAGRFGPRPGTSPAFHRAARYVARELRALGFDVRHQRFRAPAGVSWGIPVPAGRSANVVATLPGTSPGDRHLVVGAHLDTVPQAPGAEDNASGVGVMLAAAAAVAKRRTRLPVTFVAFGAEEPRGLGDAHHHYGSRAYVASLGPAERRAVAGMVSLDRVGVGDEVPVGSALAGGGGPGQRAVLAAARRAGVPAVAVANRVSDHWSFVREGLPGVRLGSTPYVEYHSAYDVASVVQPAQLERVGHVVLAWLR